MALLRFARTVYRSGGSKATARLEYITRQPERDLQAAERQLRYLREDREDLVYEHTRNLPAWAGGNPHTYFKAAERHERAGGVAFEEWKVTLPYELSHRQNMALMRDMVDAIAGTHLPITYAFHDPPTLDGTRQQPHLHLLISARQNDSHARSEATHFKRWNRDHPERGGAQKDDAFRHLGAIKAHRVLISDVVNTHLEYAGLAARVHPDRLDKRGLTRSPEPKLLPSESRAYRETGTISPRMQQVLDSRAARTMAGYEAREQVQAQQYWEGRKSVLGITRTQPMAHKLSAIREARTQIREHPPQPTAIDLDRRWDKPLLGHVVSKIYHTPDQSSYGMVGPKQQVRFRTEREAQAAGYRRSRVEDSTPWTGVRATAQTARARRPTLAEAIAGLTRRLEVDDGRGHGELHVRLDEERERARGIGW